MFGADPDRPEHVLLLFVWFRGFIVFLVLSVHTGNDSLDVSFPSVIRFSLTAHVMETGEGQLQN